MKKAKQTPDSVPWWRPPFRGNPDRAIDLASREFLAIHPTYTIGQMLAHLSQRVPQMRASLTRTHSHSGSAA